MVFMKNPPKNLREDSRDTDSDNLTRAQYYDRKSHTRHLNGESRLLFAVLEDAIRCILLGRWAAPGTEKHRELAETMVWVNIRGDRDLFAFDSICAVFEIEPEMLRRKLNFLGTEFQNRPPIEPDQIQRTSRVAPGVVELADFNRGPALALQQRLHSRRSADVTRMEVEADHLGCRMRSTRWSAISEKLSRRSVCSAFQHPATKQRLANNVP